MAGSILNNLSGTIPGVAFTRPELAQVLGEYFDIRDALGGEKVVKRQGEIHLPMPNGEDRSEKNKARYLAYKKRAVFYNVARRTMGGLIGQVFLRDPIVKIPALLDPVEMDATGSGITLLQVAKQALKLTLAYSRSGLFVDYPQVGPEGATAAQIANGDIRPTLNVYAPFNIINWRVRPRGAKDVLAMVVLSETYVSSDDGFEMKNSMQYRVLRLSDDNVYSQYIFREQTPSEYGDGWEPRGKTFVQAQQITPLGHDGLPLNEIPFTFIGGENNDSDIDAPAFYDLCSLNLAHYRNSADYEEACFTVGQPTIVVMGLNEEWYDKVLNKQINFGSRGGIPLPQGADAKLIQAEERSMMAEAMASKEAQMVALGAKLIQPNEVQQTAFEAKIDASQASSSLAQVVDNVNTAFQWALEWCALMVTGVQTGVEFSLNKDFDVSSMTPDERAQVVKDWQAGAITWDEMRAAQHRAGVATEDDAAAKKKIADDQQAELLQNAAVNPALGAPGVEGAADFIKSTKAPPKGAPPNAAK